MKRKGNLYNNMLKIENIISAYNEVCSHTRNKKKVRNYKEYKCIYITRIYVLNCCEAAMDRINRKSKIIEII